MRRGRRTALKPKQLTKRDDGIEIAVTASQCENFPYSAYRTLGEISFTTNSEFLFHLELQSCHTKSQAVAGEPFRAVPQNIKGASE